MREAKLVENDALAKTVPGMTEKMVWLRIGNDFRWCPYNNRFKCGSWCPQFEITKMIELIPGYNGNHRAVWLHCGDTNYIDILDDESGK